MSTQNLKAHERKRRLEQAALSGRLDEARRFQYCPAHRPDRDTRPWRYGDRSRGAASPEVQGEPGRERLPVLKDMAVLLKGVPPLCWNQAGGARSSPVSHGS